MIKDIFLPEKIHAYYLFTQRIVAIEVTSDTLLTTVVRAHRRKKSIQKYLRIKKKTFQNYVGSSSKLLICST